MTLQPKVVDLSHHNTVEDLGAVAGSGVWGVIHKATQGSTYRDPDYPARRAAAKASGLLWGAYHFCDSSNVAAQINNFLKYARPGSDTLLVLDFEDLGNRSMTVQNLVGALRLLEQRTGAPAVLYSGNRIKEHIQKLSPSDRAYVASHALWLCEYGPRPMLPPFFARSFLWQFTDGNVGPLPHSVPGVSGGADLNAYNGTKDQLTAAWRGPPLSVVASSHCDAAQRDDDSGTPADADANDANNAEDDSDSSALPPFMRPDVPDAPSNVQPQTASYDLTVEVVQRSLDEFGYHEVGLIDGRWGGRTAAAIKAFFNDRGVTETAQMGPTLNDEIARAKREGWTRKIAPERANATPKDIAPKVETVRVSLWTKFCAKIAAGGAALGLTGSTMLDLFQTVREKLDPITSAFNIIPGSVWFLMMLGVAGGVWYATSRAANAATKDYNTGRLN